MKGFTQTEKLQAIARGEITGEVAVETLRTACAEHREATKENFEHGSLISQAEARLIYGELGRPAERSYL